MKSSVFALQHYLPSHAERAIIAA